MTDTELHGTAGHGRKSLALIPDEVKFYPHQLDGVRILARKTSFLLADEMGGGKAQPNDTLVATPDGWRPIGALKVGDIICRPSGGRQAVAAVHPQGVVDVARITLSDGTSTTATWDHLWAVQRAAEDWDVLTTNQLHQSGLSGPDGRPAWRLPVATTLDRATGPVLPRGLDPMAAGFALVGGLTFTNKRSDYDSIPLARGRRPGADQLSIPESFTTPDTLEGMHPDDLKPFIRLLGEAGIDRQTTKRIFPPGLLNSSAYERVMFFMGMVLGAGEVSPESGHVFGIRTHRQMRPDTRRDIAALVRTIGGAATIKGDYVQVQKAGEITLHTGVTIRTPAPDRRIVQIAPAGQAECTCITVDDDEGLYVTEHAIVTHNSLQALAVTAIDYELGRANKTLIVCPSTLKDNWASEIAQHTNFRAVVCTGTPAKRAKIIEDFRTDPDLQILIVNYEQVPGHLDDINGCHLDVLIFDEAHYLKSPKSKRTKACHKIYSGRSFLLTGSPMLNQPEELWGILHRINPEEFPSFWRFKQRYCVMGGFKAKQVVGIKNKLELMEILDRYMLRRLKSEMIKLPPKNHIPVHVPLSTLQKKLYQQALDELRLDIPNEPEPMELENAMVKTLRLKQITGTPATLGYDDDSAKLDRVMEIIEQLMSDGEKVVVFSQFRGVLSAMEERLAAAAVPTWVLHGDVPQPKRVPLIHEWRDLDGPAVLLAGLQVAGVGLDFTAASNMIFIDKLYVPKMNEQAEDRCHRLSMDKTKPVTIYEMLCVGTVEEKVEKILARKRKMNDEIIDPGDYKKLVIAALHDDE